MALTLLAAVQDIESMEPAHAPELWWLWLLVALLIIAGIAWIIRRYRPGGPGFP